MTPRRLNPYRQGRLDGLCGVYALINALRLLCPKLGEDACERVFCALIRARARQAASSPLAVISGGLSRREPLKLIGPWQRFAAREFGVTLSVSRLKVPEPTLRGIWRSLSRALDSKSVAIVGLDGVERHWTVAYAATERTLRVADSCGLRLISRSQCTVGRTSVRYRLRPSEVLVVRRERVAVQAALPVTVRNAPKGDRERPLHADVVRAPDRRRAPGMSRSFRGIAPVAGPAPEAE